VYSDPEFDRAASLKGAGAGAGFFILMEGILSWP
jgi:hypothetical protein